MRGRPEVAAAANYEIELETGRNKHPNDDAPPLWGGRRTTAALTEAVRPSTM